MNRFKTLLRGLQLMAPSERRRSFGILALMMGAGFLESIIVALVIPIVYVAVDPSKFESTKLGMLLKSVFSDQSPDHFFVYLASSLVALLIVSSAISMMTRYLSELHGTRCMNRLGAQVLQGSMAAPYAWALGQDTTRLSNYVLEDVRMWRRDFLGPLFAIAQSSIMIIAPVAVTLALAPVNGLIALGTAAGVIAAVIIALRRKIYQEAVRSREAQYHFIKLVRQIVGGLREIKVSGRGQYFVNNFERSHESYSRSTVRLRAWSEAPTTTVMLLGQIGFLATGVVLFLSNTSRAEIAGQLALIGFVITRVLPALNRLAIQLPNMTRAAPYVHSIFRLFDELKRTTSERQAAGGARVPSDWRTLVFDHASFLYPGTKRFSLRNADLTIDRPGFYGFVGQSGAGKTTLANLLLGLIDPTNGVVRLDGRPLPEFSRSDWQRRFGYVPQDAFILDDTVRENITFGVVADDAAIWTALSRAQLAEVIKKLDGGLDAQVGEGGRQLSAGQVQRLAIARALIRQPDILFLDEATSALDTVTEGEVLSALHELRGTTMIIMITHRVHSLRGCDKIFVLEQGALVAEGTYDELEKSSRHFCELTTIGLPALQDA